MKRTAAWFLVLAAVLVAIVVLAGYFSGIGGSLLDLWSMWYTKPFDRVQCANIASLVASRRLTPDSAGVVVLPAGMPRATIDGRVYVTRKSGGRLFVLFPMNRGHDADLEGYLYSSQPVTRADEIDPGAPGPEIIAVTGPNPVVIPKRPTRYAGPVEYTITRKVGPNWYAVSYEMD